MSDNAKTIGIWGTSKAGKTTYIAMLYHTLLADPNWDILAADDESKQFIEQAKEAVFGNGVFPPNTITQAEYTFQIHYRPNDSTYTLKFFDSPGELFERYYNRDERDQPTRIRSSDQSSNQLSGEHTPQHVFNTLAACDGILVFIDRSWATQKRNHNRRYHILLSQLLEDFRSQGVSDKRYSFCITKADADDSLWHQRHVPTTCPHRSASNDTVSLLDDDLDDMTATRSQPNCATACAVYQELGRTFMTKELPGLVADINHTRCFVVSSIGRKPDDSANVGRSMQWRLPPSPIPKGLSVAAESLTLDIQPQDMPTEKTFQPTHIGRVDDIEPHGIINPLCWLLDIRC